MRTLSSYMPEASWSSPYVTISFVHSDISVQTSALWARRAVAPAGAELLAPPQHHQQRRPPINRRQLFIAHRNYGIDLRCQARRNIAGGQGYGEQKQWRSGEAHRIPSADTVDDAGQQSRQREGCCHPSYPPAGRKKDSAPHHSAHHV